MDPAEKYRFLDHTADVMFEAFGKDFPQALEHAAEALFETIAKTDALGTGIEFEARVQAPALEELVNFVLSDLLSESDASEVFFKSFKVKEFHKSEAGFQVVGVAYGEPYSEDKGNTHVKAVTHHRTEVQQSEKGWRIQVVLDI